MFGKKKDDKPPKKGNGKQPEQKKTVKPATKPAKAPAESKKTDKTKTIHLQGIYGQHPAVKASELKPGDITVWNGGYTEKIVAVEPSKSGKTVKATFEYKDSNGKKVRATRKFGADRLVGIDNTKAPAEPKKTVKPAAKPAKAPVEPQKADKPKVPKKPTLNDLKEGKTYREKVNSEKGYEDWEFTGKIVNGPNGKLYAFENDRGVQYFDSEDLKHFTEKATVARAPKKTVTPKKPSEQKPAANPAKAKTPPKKPAAAKLPFKKLTGKEHDNFENGVTGAAPLPLGLKPKTVKELRHVVKGGFTVWDGLQRTGKTFETKKEADDYAEDFFKKTGIKVSVTSTNRNVTHTFREEQQRKKK